MDLRSSKLSILFMCALIHDVTSQQCDIREENLQLKYDFGLVKPLDYPNRIPTLQSCTWKFPNDKFPGRPVFIYVAEVELKVNNKPIGDITMGDSDSFYKLPRANCRLYGNNITDMNWENVNKLLLEKHVNRGRSCNAWLVDHRPVEKVHFRSFGTQNEAYPNTKFMLIYEYLPLESLIQQPQATTLGSDVQMTDFSSLEISTPGSTSNIYDEISDKSRCATNTPYIILIIILAISLLGCVVFLIYLILRQRSAKRMLTLSSASSPRIHVTTSNTIESNESTGNTLESTNTITSTVERGNANPTYSMAEDVGPTESTSNTTNTYATVGNPTVSVNNQLSPSGVNPMYDVPTNNRERAPTATSSTSNVSDPYYQIPSGRVAGSSNVKDVYAVVVKDRKN